MAFAEWLHATALSETIRAVSWIVPLVQSIHILMIGIVFVSSLVIALRVLGRMRADESFATVWGRFSPWMFGALLTMVVTGVLMVIGEPARQFNSLSFWLKMGLLALAVIATVLLRVLLRHAPHDADMPLAGPARPMAVGLVVLWLAIIFLGRAIAYDVEVWGALSPQQG